MNEIVVDSNIVSYQFKRDPRAWSYDQYLAGKIWYLSFMTLAELDRWTLARRWGNRKLGQLNPRLTMFKILYADRNLCHWWAFAKDSADRAGRTIDAADAWIAATALALGVPLVTNNANDFAGVEGLEVLSAEP